ncbi:hybrid sensor histidine kinase/response regulator [Verminephrobacter aporrectodeae]|uniref:Response regulator n=1 Tax=Verminephrobacter aporrectodeae subsp. tuberculatae TaxID=1110392 RepID=A0ABT3KSY7_9BURK|nr:ATP-binding protein [Verminephrobacter aporrectodeae]MCW5222426.1 response regulator [Verminephrobacter aporrectodeae subsp. tuberculatae]MCW5257368.1 response regulator [Verminephrobacter aporrectodeae subsp. tuberculatae]MCW5287891.1 response regulator [Verminephrobacter aporrectodeae subsp. tuberculatae]MCW5321447.1 response regulator [Verminephrobacter aporrectodeae subsp. tuberculatae]MCW8166790.1 response regulator [Verminephrobacter aporrectodeae subsp. tuberculatae]
MVPATAEAEQALEILHLEDSPADHELAARTLRRSGLACHVRQVDRLGEFQRLTDSGRFDIILADYRLPGFTALDAWAHVACKPQHPPFILLSGAIGEAAAVDAMRLGVADYLLKDDMQRLPHVIAQALQVHEARRARELALAELAASQRRLAEFAEHLQTSIEQERAAIAREIHDDIGGALTAVRFDVAWIGRHSTDPALQEHALSAADMLQHAIEASQRIMMNLRPPVLEQGLVAAVQWLAAGFERRSGVPARVQSSSDTMHAAPGIQLVAYRTAQEALTNIAKHANPARVDIELSDREGVLTLEVADDGCGIDPRMLDKPKAFGLKGLHERARTVGGWLDISSRPGQGTSVILSIPLTASPASTDPGDAP